MCFWCLQKSKGTTTWAVFEKCQKCFMNHKRKKTYEDTSVKCHISFSHAWWVSFCSLQVLHPKKKGRKKKYVNSGTVRVNGLPVKRSPLLIYFPNDFHYLSSLSLSLSLGNTFVLQSGIGVHICGLHSRRVSAL